MASPFLRNQCFYKLEQLSEVGNGNINFSWVFHFTTSIPSFTLQKFSKNEIIKIRQKFILVQLISFLCWQRTIRLELVCCRLTLHCFPLTLESDFLFFSFLVFLLFCFCFHFVQNFYCQKENKNKTKCCSLIELKYLIKTSSESFADWRCYWEIGLK